MEIDFRPVHLRRLVEAGVGKPPELGPRKHANAANDIRHWAEALGAEFSPEARALYKSDTQLALRCALVAKDLGKFREFHYPVYRARWARGARPVAARTCSRAAARRRPRRGPVLARARSAELEERLTRETEAAIERGVFGVPTIFVGDEMFWGNDRFELVRFYAQKAASRELEGEPHVQGRRRLVASEAEGRGGLRKALPRHPRAARGPRCRSCAASCCRARRVGLEGAAPAFHRIAEMASTASRRSRAAVTRRSGRRCARTRA